MRFALLLSVVLVAPVMAQEKEVLDVPGAVAGLPFSPAVKAGNLIFLSGQIGSKLGTRGLVSGGISAETTQALQNIKQILEASGGSLDDVTKCTVFLVDLQEYDAMNKAYSAVFRVEPPARSTVEVSELVFGARVEIECVAVASK